MPGKLKVKIVAGRHLPVMDRASDLTDAFVEVGGDRGRGAPPLRHLPGPAATGPRGVGGCLHALKPRLREEERVGKGSGAAYTRAGL